MSNLTPRGYALATTALKLVSASRLARGKVLAPRPVRAVGHRRKASPK